MSILPLNGDFLRLRSNISVEDALDIQISPLNGLFKDPLVQFDTGDETYIVDLLPINGELINLAPVFKDIQAHDDGYNTGILPLNGTFKKLVVLHTENDRSYSASITPIDGEFN